MAEDAEAVLAAVPDVPDEGPLREELRVLGEEVVAQPGLEGRARGAGLGKESLEERRGPGVAVRPGEEGPEPLGGRTLAAHRHERDEAVGVGELVESIGLLVRPAVPEQAGDSDLERCLRSRRRCP